MRLRIAAVMMIGILCVPLAGVAQGAKTALTVEGASVGADGLVRLRWSGQPEQVAPRDRGGYCEKDKECEDAGADQLAVSSDRRSVGWTANYNGCCQSYPIPMVLVIARDGKIIHRIQGAMAIWRWRFEDGDAHVAVFSNTTHGNLSPTCVLYDTRTWKVIGEWHRGKGAPPGWAKGLVGAVGATGG